MKTKEITLCGKQVTVAYCYATEIAFRNFTGLNIDEFDHKNPEHYVYLFLASIQAYNLAMDTKSEIQDSDIMYSAKPEEIICGIKSIFELKADWYNIPLVEKKIDEEEAKNEHKEEDVDEESKNA